MKRWLGLFFILLSSLLYQSFKSTAWANKIEIEIEGFRSKKGSLLLAVFVDSEGFEKEKPAKLYRFKKSEFKENKLKVLVDAPGNEFGYSVLDDENENGKMDYNSFGIPSEGFGFSNYYHKGWLKPKYENFKVSLWTAIKQKIGILIKYF